MAAGVDRRRSRLQHLGADGPWGAAMRQDDPPGAPLPPGRLRGADGGVMGKVKKGGDGVDAPRRHLLCQSGGVLDR